MARTAGGAGVCGSEDETGTSDDDMGPSYAMNRNPGAGEEIIEDHTDMHDFHLYEPLNRDVISFTIQDYKRCVVEGLGRTLFESEDRVVTDCLMFSIL